MATETEKRGMAELLERMSTKDLSSLSQTVTNRLIVPETPHEAIEAIIRHTSKPLDLLKRKKITRDLMFKYLSSKRVPIDGGADKQTCARSVLELWGSSDNANIDMIVDDDLSLEGPPPPPTPSRNASHTSLCSLDQSRDGFPSSYLASIQSYNNPSGSQLQTTFPHNHASSFHNSSMLSTNHHQQPSLAIDHFSNNINNNHSGALVNTSTNSVLPGGGSYLAATSGTTLGTTPTEAQCQQMADTFVKWYYDLLNSCLQGDNPEFNPKHFFPDASAKIELLSCSGESAESIQAVENSGEVCNIIKDVIQRHRLHHNPNICDAGVKGFLDPHGLVIVLACGTLHNQHTICGTFEQIFGLARDPGSDNNWKIKHTQARLIAKSVTETPSLANSSLHALCYS